MSKHPKYTTPKGVLSYPYLNSPDTRFVEDGVFKADLIVDINDAQPLIQQLDNQLNEFVKQMEQETGKRQNRKKYRLPYDEHEEDETKIVFKVKQNALVKGKPIKLLYYDASRTKVLNPPNIFGGSVVKIAGVSRPYASGANKGITLSISAIQMLELTDDYASTADGSNFGFEEEDGFTVESSSDQFDESHNNKAIEDEPEDENGDF